MADQAKVRVVVAGMPRMLTDIVRNIIVSHDDLELAGESCSLQDLAHAAVELCADVAVIGALADDSSAAYADLLYARPRMRIVVIDADGRAARFHELRPQVTHVAEISPAILIAALRHPPPARVTP